MQAALTTPVTTPVQVAAAPFITPVTTPVKVPSPFTTPVKAPAAQTHVFPPQTVCAEVGCTENLIIFIAWTILLNFHTLPFQDNIFTPGQFYVTTRGFIEILNKKVSILKLRMDILYFCRILFFSEISFTK